MSKDEIIRLARQAQVHEELCGEHFIYEFAKLVSKAKCEELANQIEKMPFGDTSSSFAAWIREQA